MDRNVNLLVVGDMNNQQGRDLVQAIQGSAEFSLPYGMVHIDDVRAVLPGIRATPAVGIVLWASDLQEAVAIADIASLSQFVSAQADYEAIAAYAIELEYDAAMAEMGVTDDDLQAV